MPGVGQGPAGGRERGSELGLQVGPGPDRRGGVWRLGDGVHAGLELLLVTDVCHEGEQQLGAVGEMKVERLPGDADRAGQRRHGGAGTLLFGDLPRGVEDPGPCA